MQQEIYPILFPLELSYLIGRAGFEPAITNGVSPMMGA